MRFLHAVPGPLAVLLLACGGTVGATVDHDAGVPGVDSGAATEPDAGSGPLLGTLVVDTRPSPLSETFVPRLFPGSSATSVCQGASATAGSCCLFPPVGLPSNVTADGGTGTAIPSFGESAGVLTLRDDTSGASIGTFDFGNLGYQVPGELTPPPWQPGDSLSVSATGDQIGAFTVSAPALSPPTMQFPSSITPTDGLKVTWQPDPNADTMTVQVLYASEVIVCTVRDADGAVTVDPSLLSTFHSGLTTELAAYRETDRYAQTPGGRVEFSSFAYSATSQAPVK
jgi:hypothetical protein